LYMYYILVYIFWKKNPDTLVRWWCRGYVKSWLLKKKKKKKEKKKKES